MFKNNNNLIEYSQVSSQSGENKNIAFKIKIIKITIIVIVISITVINNFFGVLLPRQNLVCIDDTIFNLISPLTQDVEQSQILKDILQIFSNLCVDVVIGYSFVRWALYAKSCKFIVSVLFFYFIQIITQVISYIYNLEYFFIKAA